MKPLGRLLAAVVAIWCVGLSGAALASGRAGPALPDINAPSFQQGAPVIAGRAAWRGAEATYAGGSALVAEAARYIGSGKFTRLPGPWCADAVSAWLRAIGKPPLANRLAASALAYGPHVVNPQPGDLAVMRGHVTIVASVDGAGGFVGLGGNQGHGRVTYSHFSTRAVVAFVRPT